MSQTGPEPPSVLRAVRERSRAEITREILDAARRHLATDGASGLSLRAIARELGMSSSAVYGYVASRDELLTRLIVTAYDALGSAAEIQGAAVDREDLAGRWAAACSIVGPEVPSALLHQGLMAWAALFGTVSFELFGQLHGIVGEQPGDREAYFAESVRRWAAQLGIPPAGTAPAARKPARPLEPA